MNFKLGLSALFIASSFLFAIPGCAADASDAEDDGSAEDAAASSDEIRVATERLSGAFQLADNGSSMRAPNFYGIVFKASGDFFADADTGIRCVRAPCPSNVRLEGSFRATRNYVTLSPAANGQAHNFYGRYRYTLTNGKLSLTRAAGGTLWAGWKNVLEKETSYCGAPTDCAGQNLIHPMCVGQWTCGEQRSCGWQCGIPTPVGNAIWPADRKTLVAETAGGGFTPPPAPGSTCNVGAQKYTFDVASKKLAWEVCSFTDWQTPMHMETGSRVLTNAEAKKVDAAMKEVAVSTMDICGADKPYMSIKVTSASQGEKTYADSFYSCMDGDDVYVDNIDGVFSAFRDLVQN